MRRLLAVILASSALATPSLAEDVNVVTSIKPVHSLVANVMAGVGTPYLVVKGGASPHTYSLKPSDARALESADLVFWIGHDLEVFLAGPLETLSANAKIVTLDEAHGLITLAFRESGTFEAHAHDEETASHAEESHDHEEDHGGIDTHLWLDPLNAKAMVHEIEEALVAADPANATTYRENAQKTVAALDALVAEVDATLGPVKHKPYIVFHDAYQYFESRFGLNAAGSITVSPEAIPGAQRIAEIHDKVKQLDATCVFAEPQFEPRLVTVVTEGTNAKAGVLDPLGAELEDGPSLYFELIRNMAASMKTCLGG